MAKLKEDERDFLLSKYLSQGYSKKAAEWKLNRLLNIMVVSAATIAI